MEKAPATPKRRFPTFTRLVRGLFSWRMVRRGVVALAGLITLIALLYAEEDFRGKRAWEKYKHEQEAKGEKFDFASFIPPAVPDDQNFAMTPFLAPLFDFNPLPRKPGQGVFRDTNGYNRALNFASKELKAVFEPSRFPGLRELTDLPKMATALCKQSNSSPRDAAVMTRAAAATAVLRALEPCQPVLEELRTASRRPYARFNINYAGLNAVDILLPHLSVLKVAGTVFQLRACSELALGQTDEALKDAEMTLYLGESIKQEPFLVSGLVRIVLLQFALQPVWEGLAEHQWSDAQLAELELRLSKIDLLAGYDRQFHGELAAAIEFTEFTRSGGTEPGESGDDRMMPNGWFYQNELTIARLHLVAIFPPVDASNHRVFPVRAAEGESLIEKELYAGGFRPYKSFAAMLLPAVAKTQMKYAAAQVKVDEARVACALERYRLGKGNYPETLAALSPQFIPAIPNDIMSGEALNYRRTENGSFLLYSVGWDEKDDGGKVVTHKGTTPTVDLTQGDWVWPEYPGK